MLSGLFTQPVMSSKVVFFVFYQGCSLWKITWYADGFSLVFMSTFWLICIVSKAPCNCSWKVVQSSARFPGFSRNSVGTHANKNNFPLFPLPQMKSKRKGQCLPDVSIFNKNRNFKNIDHFMFACIKFNSITKFQVLIQII